MIKLQRLDPARAGLLEADVVLLVGPIDPDLGREFSRFDLRMSHRLILLSGVVGKDFRL